MYADLVLKAADTSEIFKMLIVPRQVV